MSDSKQNPTEAWAKLEKIKMSMLKSISIEQRVLSTVVAEVWSKVYGQPDLKLATKRYAEVRKSVREDLENHLFAEYGSIDLTDIFPDEAKG